MDSRIRQIEDGLKRLFRKDSDSFVAQLISQDDYVCEVKDLNGTTYVDVRKTATENKDGLIYTFKANSYLIVSRLSNSDQLYVAMFSELEGFKVFVNGNYIEINNDGIKLSGEANGGIIAVGKLSAEIAKITAAITTLMAATSAGLGTIPGVGSASATAFNVACSTIQTADLTNVTNDKIKH